MYIIKPNSKPGIGKPIVQCSEVFVASSFEAAFPHGAEMLSGVSWHLC